jgi:hypothetical protein
VRVVCVSSRVEAATTQTGCKRYTDCLVDMPLPADRDRKPTHRCATNGISGEPRGPPGCASRSWARGLRGRASWGRQPTRVYTLSNQHPDTIDSALELLALWAPSCRASVTAAPTSSEAPVARWALRPVRCRRSESSWKAQSELHSPPIEYESTATVVNARVARPDRRRD